MEYYSLLNQSISDKSSKIQNLSLSYSTLQNSLNEIKRSMKHQDTLSTANDFTLTLVAINAVDEISERDKRKSTLIIHNFLEVYQN